MPGVMSAKPKSKEIVVRITGLPIWTTIKKLKCSLIRKFPNEDTDFTITETTLCPSCYNDHTKIAITKFSPHCPDVLAQLTNGASFVTKFEGYDIRIDKDFYGLTQLYTTEGPIKADIVALSGLDGHAYGSWRAKTQTRRMWLRDFLPQDFLGCRTMTYGYNSKLQCQATQTLLDFTRGFLEELEKTRETDAEKKRPIVFIGHSFGGIVIVQSLVRAAQRQDDRFLNSLIPATYATIFFGTPHRGLITDDIKSMLDEDSPRQELLDSINKGSDALKNELKRFIDYCKTIKIVSFYETKLTRKLKKEDGRWSRSGEFFKAVNDESAILELPDLIEKPIPAEGDHSDMVKLCHRSELVYTSILSHLKKFRLNENTKLADVEGPIATYSAFSIRRDAFALRRLLESGLLDPDEPASVPYLHQAVMQEDRETISILLDHRVNIEKVDDQGRTALQIAASRGSAVTFGLLLRNGAKNDLSIWDAVVIQGHSEIVKILCEYGVIPEVNSEQISLVELAARGGHVETLRLLLKNRSSLRNIKQDDSAALRCAVEKGHCSVVRLLIDNDGSISESDLAVTLKAAAASGYAQIVEFILEKTEKCDSSLSLALKTAVENGHTRVVEIILKQRSDILKLSRVGKMTLLQISSQKGHTEIVKLLLEGGADTEEEMYETGKTALHLALSPEIVDLLLLNGANITAEDRTKCNRQGYSVKGFTKLHDAASWGQLEVVKILLKHGIDINLRDSDGHTPAYYANVTSHWETLDYLHSRGGVTTLATSDSRCVIG